MTPTEPPEKVAIRQLSEKLQIEMNSVYNELRNDIDTEFKAQRKLQVRIFLFLGPALQVAAPPL